ncbi:MAG: hypothetical protein WKF30_07105, partial [Pyrinomonadaceae bacterium]
VVGFAIHNATEGFGIAAPLVGQQVSWARLLLLGLTASAPLALGAALGGVGVSPAAELLCLSVATGSLVYVARELQRLRVHKLGIVATITALACGFLLGLVAEIVASAVLARGGSSFGG